MVTDDVLIIGAGPVGLLLALLLAKRGIFSRILEAMPSLSSGSRAIGIMPPSLDLLSSLGLAEQFIQQGVAIRTVELHRRSRDPAPLVLNLSHDSHDFVLSHPQEQTLNTLLAAAERAPEISIEFGREVVGISSGMNRVRVEALGERYEAPWVVACDGCRSVVREALQIPSSRRTYAHHFRMADFQETFKDSEPARLWFTHSGAVESFPLPNGMRRWIVQEPQGWSVSDVVKRRTGCTLAKEIGRVWDFQPYFQLANPFGAGRVLLAGDAAHVCAPIGGQGMNCGFGDALALANLFAEGATREQAQRYSRNRTHRFLKSARLAERGMWIGTRVGWQATPRTLALQGFLRCPPIQRWVANKVLMRK